MQKSFDWMNRYKLLVYYYIDGNVFRSIKALHSQSVSCIKLNEMLMITSGVKQGDSLLSITSYVCVLSYLHMVKDNY